MPNWKKVVVSGSDAALNSISSSLGIYSAGDITAPNFIGTASYATYAVTAETALNGGVTQLLAGPNISLSPLSGLGQVTISSTGGSGGYNTATGSYGSFYDTTTQTNPVANAANSMSFNTTDISNGVLISGSVNPYNTYLKVLNAGVYNIQFSAQVEKTDSGTDIMYIWLRKNGIDLEETATAITLQGNGAKSVAAWNWFALASANDYYQLIWSSPDTDVRLYAEPPNSVPGIPSIILTANRIDQFLSNTGSFKGTFTGDLIGTASRATSSSIADSIRITNDANNRIITSNGNNTLNAETNLSFDGSTLNLTGSYIQRGSIHSVYTDDGLALSAGKKQGGYNYIQLGDPEGDINKTTLIVDDAEEIISFSFNSASKYASASTHYFDGYGLLVEGSVRAGDYTGRNLHEFTGSIVVTGDATIQSIIYAESDIYNSGSGQTLYAENISGLTRITGPFLENNANNRVITSNGNGTFTAEAGLTYTPHTLNISGSVIATGDITTYGNLIAKQFIISSSVSYFTESFSSGSTKFGDSSDDTHQFTGSILVTGSITSNTLSVIGSNITDSTIINNPVIKFTNLPENLNGEMEGVVVWDSAQGQLYWTSSLGNGFTTAHNLQQVTTAGSSTTIPITASIISASDSIFTSQSHTTTLSFKAPLTSTSSFEILSIPTNHHSVKGVIRESLTLDSNAYGNSRLFKVTQSISAIEIKPTIIYNPVGSSSPTIFSLQLKLVPSFVVGNGELYNNSFEYDTGNISFTSLDNLGSVGLPQFFYNHNIASATSFWSVINNNTFIEFSFIRDANNSQTGNLANTNVNIIIPYEIYQY